MTATEAAAEEAAMRVLVAGANGSTGRRVVRRLAASPHEPVAMVRDPDQRPRFEEAGVATVLADLEEPLEHAVTGCDAVVFCAGSGAGTGLDKTRDVDRDGAIRLADTAEEAGVRLFLMLSSMGADPDARGEGMAVYYRCKGEADEHLRGTGLTHAIVRPGRLTEEAGDGRIDAAAQLGRSGRIPRDDVADVLVACLEAESAWDRTFEILDGDTPVEEALAAL